MTVPFIPAHVKVMKIALHANNLPAMEKGLHQVPTLLEGDEDHRTELALAALGTGRLSEAKQLANWDWLDSKGFQFPSTPEKRDEIWGRLLESGTVGLLDAWRLRTLDSPIPVTEVRRLLFGRTADKLEWWCKQGLPLDVGPVGASHLPTLHYALSVHQLQRTETVLFLLEHGVHPTVHVNQDHSQTKKETPLLYLARMYQEQNENNTLPNQGHTHFRILWDALVKAGDDPAYCNDQGECPQDVIMDTPARIWWEASHRQTQLLQPEHQPATPARPRRRRT